MFLFNCQNYKNADYLTKGTKETLSIFSRYYRLYKRNKRKMTATDFILKIMKF